VDHVAKWWQFLRDRLSSIAELVELLINSVVVVHLLLLLLLQTIVLHHLHLVVDLLQFLFHLCLPAVVVLQLLSFLDRPLNKWLISDKEVLNRLLRFLNYSLLNANEIGASKCAAGNSRVIIRLVQLANLIKCLCMPLKARTAYVVPVVVLLERLRSELQQEMALVAR
jgi:hypothetical protein